jgi:cytochrome c peroxidase
VKIPLKTVPAPALFIAAFAFTGFTGVFVGGLAPASADRELRAALAGQGFTGRVESTLEQRLGRPLDPAKAELGRLLFFDKFVGLHGDNSCAGCHSPLNGFGDSVSMAIGVENNDFVGPQRAGPRNQRRTPAVVNTAFYPKTDVEWPLQCNLRRSLR